MAQRRAESRSTREVDHREQRELAKDGHGANLEELVASRLRVLFRASGDALAGNVYEQVIQRVERPLLQLALEHTGGNQLRAAELLGLNRNTLRKKIADLGIYALDDDARGAARSLGPRKPPRAARSRRR